MVWNQNNGKPERQPGSQALWGCAGVLMILGLMMALAMLLAKTIAVWLELLR